MESLKRTLAKVLYGFLFVVVLPAGLMAWAIAARNVVHLHALHSELWGAALAGGGLAILIWGMLSLWIYGGGLPMNAFPPERFVRRGAYALIPHPIYGGFILICGGVPICFGSASGLWLVTPTVALSCAALVLGYELPDLRRRFGKQVAPPSVRDGALSPPFAQRMRVAVMVLVPWLAAYGMIWLMGRQPGAISTYLPFENQIPIVEWSELFYASTYAVVILTPLLARNQEELRKFMRLGIGASVLFFSLYLLLPVFVPPRPFSPNSSIGGLLLRERTPYSGAGAFPSFHVAWALIAASVLGSGGRARRTLWWAWAAMVAASCVMTGMHSILDVVGGAAAFWLVLKMNEIWKRLLMWAERVANSWRERRIGAVRIINHGGYAALGAFVGVLIIAGLLGEKGELAAVSIFVCAMVGAALWAQWVEGSPALLRPLGFYGGMAGAIVGGILARLIGVSVWPALAAIAVAAPWIQALGRLRCLVQGCCHGCATETVEGIRYSHPQSRVCRLAHLAGVPVHATPLYSIVWNVWVGLMLLRLMNLHCASTLIAGSYLILSGAGRFVEEAYRGEPQTKILFGLRLYQWIAILTVAAGAVIMTVSAGPLPQPFDFRVSIMLLAAACGAITWFVTGVDFPESSRRFARLT